MTTSAKNVRRIREFIGLSQHDFAEYFDILRRRDSTPSADILSAYERGVTPVPGELLKKISDACKINIQDLNEKELQIHDLKDVKLPPKEIDLTPNTLHEADHEYDKGFKERYYALIVENNKNLRDYNSLLKDQVKMLTESVIKVETSLQTALVNQREIAAMQSAFRKLFVDWMGKTKHQDPKTLLRTLHIDAVRMMKVFEQKGSLLEIDNGDNQ